MENYFHKNKSFFVVKTFEHFIHKYNSCEKGWIQSDLNKPSDLLRSKGQRRGLFPQTEIYVFKSFMFHKKEQIHTPKKLIRSKNNLKKTHQGQS